MSQVDAHLDEIRRKYIAAPLADAFKAGLEAGFRDGAEAMRNLILSNIVRWQGGGDVCGPECEQDIRALPRPEPETPK